MKIVSGIALSIVGLVAVVATIDRIDLMRLQLPVRLWFSNLDIYRSEGWPDFAMCMRAPLHPDEIDSFLAKFFSVEQRQIARTADAKDIWCNADFWPGRFESETLAYAEDRAGTSGAVFEAGYLYFWSNQI